MLSLKTPFSRAWGVLKPEVDPLACAHIITFWDDYLRAHPKASFEEAIASIPLLYLGREAGDKWARWVLMTFPDQLEGEVKAAFFNHITKPVSRFRVWQASVGKVSSSELMALRDTWVNDLPELAKRHG